jgi:hypothetical protein
MAMMILIITTSMLRDETSETDWNQDAWILKLMETIYTYVSFI